MNRPLLCPLEAVAVEGAECDMGWAAKGKDCSRAVALVQQTSEGGKSWHEPTQPPLHFFPSVCQESQKDGKTIQLCPLLLVSGNKKTPPSTGILSHLEEGWLLWPKERRWVLQRHTVAEPKHLYEWHGWSRKF